jgi:hypothetical protein
MNKKGVSGGLVSGLVFGIAGLVIVVIIALVITSTMSNSGLIDNDAVYTTTVINESVTFDNKNTVKTLAAGIYGSTDTTISCGALTYAANGTNVGVSVGLANFTKSGCTVVNATAMFPVDASEYWNASYTQFLSYTYTTTVSKTKNTAYNMSPNFTSGINNVSAKIPTALLVGAIVLILGILAVLVGVWRKMRMGGSI